MKAIGDMLGTVRLETLLGAFGLSKSTYYYRLGRMRRTEDPVLEEICRIFEDSGRMYGHRKVTAELARRGINRNRKTVQKIMKENNLRCLYRVKRYRRAKSTGGAPAPNVLDRGFSAESPSRKFVTDVTEFNVAGGRLYLSAIMDLFGRSLTAFSMSRSNDCELVMEMMRKLESACPDLEGALVHSDQGGLYKSDAYRSFAKEHGIVRSMSRRGNCYDNAVIESFFGQLKSEIGPASGYRNINALRCRIEQFVDYYNNSRIQLGLGGMSPAEYRAKKYNLL